MRLLNKIIKSKKEEKLYFEKIADEWLEYKRNMVKESTYCNYVMNIEKHLKPYFRGKKINQITNCNELVKELSENLGTKTIRDIITILKAIFRYYEEEYNDKLKIKKVSIPKQNKVQVKILTKREKGRLEKYCLRKNNLKTIGILICLNTGLRIGEICSLKWKDIDLVERKIKVKKTIQRLYDKKNNNTKMVIDKPKTESSIRTIPINTKLYDILKPLSKKYKPSDFILSGTEKFFEPRHYQYVYKNILKESRIEPYKFHTLRHTFATECIEVGMDVKSLSEMLGHANIGVTLKIYVHSSDQLKKKYLEKL